MKLTPNFWIIDIAALPTAPMAKALKRKGSIAPMNKPAITFGAETSITSMPAVSLNAANKASAVRRQNLSQTLFQWRL